MKLNLGCGTLPLAGWVNVDIAPLQGVDYRCDLNQLPYPWVDNSVDEIRLINTLEHLDSMKTVAIVEELWRVLKPNGCLTVRVPYYNSWEYAADPTHQRAFCERTMNFFDPATEDGRQRHYYSKATFTIESVTYFLPLWRFSHRPKLWVAVRNRFVKSMLHTLAHYLCGVIWVLEYEMVAVK